MNQHNPPDVFRDSAAYTFTVPPPPKYNTLLLQISLPILGARKNLEDVYGMPEVGILGEIPMIHGDHRSAFL